VVAVYCVRAARGVVCKLRLSTVLGAAWLRRHAEQACPDVRELQKKVDILMANFDATQQVRCWPGAASLFLLGCEALTTHVEQSKHQARAGAAKTDADGFTLVTGKRRRRMGDTDDVGGLTSSATGEKRRRKKGPMELSNFYRFQVRESKRDRRWPLVPRCAMVGDSRACRIVPELALLRAKFEEDKERIRRLQASRPFRPHR